ncbi:MAG: hypothetical protein M3R51_01060 [Candidatus Eremiobacteraeota bacterium]|nr:hypothetical protein [Candidatus Eremiobacteraeota bacterium]
MSISERGDTLIEVVVSAGIVAVTLGTLIGGSIVAAHRFGADPVKDALQNAVRNEMRIAVNIGKYQGTTFVPQTVATTVPMPGGSALPAHISLAVAALPANAVAVTIAASSELDPTESVTLRSVLTHPAPLPSSTVSSGSSAAAPLGAP